MAFHGRGSVSNTPDKATVDLAVQTQDRAAAAVLDQNSGDTSGLLTTLFAGGI